MKHIKEPHQLVSSSDIIDLVNCHQSEADRAFHLHLIDEEGHEELYNRYNHHKDKATKNLRKFNRKILQN